MRQRVLGGGKLPNINNLAFSGKNGSNGCVSISNSVLITIPLFAFRLI